MVAVARKSTDQWSFNPEQISDEDGVDSAALGAGEDEALNEINTYGWGNKSKPFHFKEWNLKVEQIQIKIVLDGEGNHEEQDDSGFDDDQVTIRRCS